MRTLTAIAAVALVLLSPAHHRPLVPCHGVDVRPGGHLVICPGFRRRDL